MAESIPQGGAPVCALWKNGGGETAEVLCHPAGAAFDDFDWRISTARVDRSGPFSAFPGVDRVLTVLEGDTMVLTFAEGSRIDTSPTSGPHPFSGETSVMHPCRVRAGWT